VKEGCHSKVRVERRGGASKGNTRTPYFLRIGREKAGGLSEVGRPPFARNPLLSKGRIDEASCTCVHAAGSTFRLQPLCLYNVRESALLDAVQQC